MASVFARAVPLFRRQIFAEELLDGGKPFGEFVIGLAYLVDIEIPEINAGHLTLECAIHFVRLVFEGDVPHDGVAGEKYGDFDFATPLQR